MHAETAPMQDQIAGFLSEPTTQSFAALRAVVLASPAYHPDSDAFDRFQQCLDSKDVAAAQRLVSELIPCFLLNPRTHAALAYLHRLGGDEEGEEFEHYFTFQLQQFLLSSGDGSAARPYRVSCVDDEYFVVTARKAQPRGLAWEWVGGRLHDVVHTDQGELYFDVDQVLEAYS